MNPVQSSSAPFLEPPGHRHAINRPLRLLSYFSGLLREVNEAKRTRCPMITIWMILGGCAEIENSLSAKWRKRILRCSAELARLFHEAVVNAHELRVIVIFENQLPGPELGFLPQQDFGSQLALQVFQCGADVRIRMNLGGCGCASA